MREELKKGKEYCVGQFKKRASHYDSRLKQTQSQLKQVSARANESERHDLHCRIQDVRMLKSQAEALASHAVPIAYENKGAKLDLIEKTCAGHCEQAAGEAALGTVSPVIVGLCRCCLTSGIWGLTESWGRSTLARNLCSQMDKRLRARTGPQLPTCRATAASITAYTDLSLLSRWVGKETIKVTRWVHTTLKKGETPAWKITPLFAHQKSSSLL